MKKQFYIISYTGLLTFCMFQLSAQVVITTDTVPANSSAMLEVRSATRGVLFPRVSQAQMQAISNPMNGLMVYCVTDNKFYSYIAGENGWRDLKYGTDSITMEVPNAPVTTLPVIQASPGSTISIPVKVTGFNNIGSLSLTLQFNSSVLTYNSCNTTSGFPGLSCDNPSPGLVAIGGFTPYTGITLPDNTTLFTVDFIYVEGTSTLTWFDNGGSCEYTGPAPLFTVLPDTPQSIFYINGSVSSPSWP